MINDAGHDENNNEKKHTFAVARIHNSISECHNKRAIAIEQHTHTHTKNPGGKKLYSMITNDDGFQ